MVAHCLSQAKRVATAGLHRQLLPEPQQQPAVDQASSSRDGVLLLLERRFQTLGTGMQDARRVCEHLGLPLLEADFVAEYWHRVFQPFLDMCGSPKRTPQTELKMLGSCAPSVSHSMWFATPVCCCAAGNGPHNECTPWEHDAGMHRG